MSTSDDPVKKEWNPLFVAYARAHGKTPEEMDAHDDKAWPGGPGCGFHFWMRDRKKEYWKRYGVEHMMDEHTICHYEHWYAFVIKRGEELSKETVCQTS
jgi:hypothetical protein